MKTIDIQVTRWFQKSYGNTYFSGIITIDFDLNTEKQIELPFQYGYGNHFEDIAKRKLFPENPNALWRICEEKNIDLRINVQDVKRKRDMI